MDGCKERGVYVVEFAIIGVLMFTILFGILEFGRLLLTVNTLNESVRRGARLAAVCDIGDERIRQRAVFAEVGSTTSTIIGNLSTANVSPPRYLDEDGKETADFNKIRFVEIEIPSFRFNFLVPLIGTGITLQPFRAVLPRESLGRTPESSEITPC
ncbi:TadE-like protein [compost metagenome]